MRRARIAFAATVVAASASPATAQAPLRPEDLPGWSVVPAVQTIAVYENNLLVTAQSESKGAFARVTPSLETRYRGPRGFLSLGYSFDSDRHTRQLKVLDDMFARQYAVMNFASQPSERSSISGRTSFLSTQRPEETLDATGLVVLNERRTKRFVEGLAVARKISEASQANVDYLLTVDDFGQATETRPGARTMLHSLTSSITFRTAERTTLGVEHTGKVLIGDDRTPSTITRGVFWANSIGLRWTHDVTSNLKLVVAAGPRLAQTVPPVIDPLRKTATRWHRQPELLASLSYRLREQVLAIAYARTQILGFGATGFIDTESFDIRTMSRIGKRLQLTGRPGIYRNTLAGFRANSFRIETTAHYPVSRWMSLDGLFGYRHQDRALGLADFAVASIAKSRTRTRLAFGVTLRRPIRME